MTPIVKPSKAWLILAALFVAHGANASTDAQDLPEYRQWNERLTIARKRHDAAEELLCLTTIGHRWPWALGSLSSELIDQVMREAQQARLGHARTEVLQMLFDRRWRYADGTEPSAWWSQLSLDLLEHGRTEEACAVATHIANPYVLIGLQADNRYRQIESCAYVEHNVPRAAQAELERRAQLAAASPRDLSRAVRQTYSMMILHKYQDALDATTNLLDTAQNATSEVPPYDDLQRQLPWVLDARARALSALGRNDEALSFLQSANSATKGDRSDHALNLAQFLALVGRSREALSAIPPADGLSPYGLARAAMVRVMAASGLDDMNGLNDALQELRARTQDYLSMRQHGLIAAGRDDEAAVTLLARLSDPTLRNDALVELQDYAERPLPERAATWRARGKALRNRPEVRQAIASYGRIRSYSIED